MNLNLYEAGRQSYRDIAAQMQAAGLDAPGEVPLVPYPSCGGWLDGWRHEFALTGGKK